MVFMVVNYCRRVVRMYPRLRKLLLPIFSVSIPYLYALRNALNRRPIQIHVGSNDTVSMLPKGHIAKAMWLDAFEKVERNFVESFLKPGMSVINVGANTGLYTLIAAKIIGPTGIVHAFEPSSLNFDRLKRNVKLNLLDNVCLNQMAISDFSGTLAVMFDPENPSLDSHYFVQCVDDDRLPDNMIEKMPCETIDNYCVNARKIDFDSIDMMIIDVEGAEFSVFMGALSLLEKSQNLIIMVECTENLEEINELLRGLGFSFYVWNVSKASLEDTSINRGTLYAMREGRVMCDSERYV